MQGNHGKYIYRSAAVRRGVVTIGLGLVLGFVLVHLLGCTDKAPPIVQGKCVVDHYEGKVATKQICKFDTQSYSCTDKNCDRLPEQTLERPPAIPTKP